MQTQIMVSLLRACVTISKWAFYEMGRITTWFMGWLQELRGVMCKVPYRC